MGQIKCEGNGGVRTRLCDKLDGPAEVRVVAHDVHGVIRRRGREHNEKPLRAEPHGVVRSHPSLHADAALVRVRVRNDAQGAGSLWERCKTDGGEHEDEGVLRGSGGSTGRKAFVSLSLENDIVNAHAGRTRRPRRCPSSRRPRSRACPSPVTLSHSSSQNAARAVRDEEHHGAWHAAAARDGDKQRWRGGRCGECDGEPDEDEEPHGARRSCGIDTLLRFLPRREGAQPCFLEY